LIPLMLLLLESTEIMLILLMLMLPECCRNALNPSNTTVVKVLLKC
jgi:hypothetical protein